MGLNIELLEQYKTELVKIEKELLKANSKELLLKKKKLIVKIKTDEPDFGSEKLNVLSVEPQENLSKLIAEKENLQLLTNKYKDDSFKEEIDILDKKIDVIKLSSKEIKKYFSLYLKQNLTWNITDKIVITEDGIEYSEEEIFGCYSSNYTPEKLKNLHLLKQKFQLKFTHNLPTSDLYDDGR